MLPVLVRWVQNDLYCPVPPTLPLGSVPPVFGPFYCDSCRRHPHTLRSDWALLLCCAFGGWYRSYRCPPFMLLVGVGTAVTPLMLKGCRSSHLARFWRTDFDITCREDTAIRYRPSALLHASLPSPPHLPSSRRPPYRQQHVYQRRRRTLGQTAVLLTPQPGGPRDRKGTLETTLGLMLGISRLETGRMSRRGLRRRHPGQHEGHRQDKLTDWVDSPVRKEIAEQPSPGSGARRQLSPAPGEHHQVASPR